MKLYHYWRSSCSWRVRWALELKGIPCEFEAVNLLEDQQQTTSHLERNPMGQVPVLEWQDARSKERFLLSDSLAILSWLEANHPSPALLPKDPLLGARTLELQNIIACGTQPIQNLVVLKHYSSDQKARLGWAQHWNLRGLRAYESQLERHQPKGASYSLGNDPTWADLSLIPQCYNAFERFQVSQQDFPRISAIYQHARATEACKRASPEAFQPQ